MAKANTDSEAVVNTLLAERNQYQTWITRLDSTKDTTPAAVRTKVLADYRERLTQVIEKLTEHADAVRSQLESRKARKEELVAEELKAKETLAEAELRHAVGEYDEGDWTKVRAESNKILVGTREELAKVVEDIERLAEVAKLIATPVVPVEPPPPPPAPPAPKPAAVVAPAVADAPPRRDSGRAEFVPNVAKAKPPTDELEFLRATVGEEEAPAPPKSVKLEKDRKGKGEAAPATATAPAVPEAELSGPLPKPERSNENRTLKCPECGTMNRATEWYCERCGSELAGV